MKFNFLRTPQISVNRIAYSFSAMILFFGLLSCNAGKSNKTTGTSSDREGYKNLAEQVEIKRTEMGVPHITAENLKAAGYALGYAQMEDYGNKVVKELLRARGEYAKYHELSSTELERALDNDVAGKIKHDKAVKTYSQLNQDTRDMVEGFAIAVNRYIELHPEKFDDAIKPFFTAYDVQSVEIENIPMSSAQQFLRNLRKKESQEKNGITGLLNQESNVWTSLAVNYESPQFEFGSNAWALAPNRTTSGNAILLRNPHLNWDAGYYEVHMKVKDKFDYYGDFRIGAPLITIGGFNERLGWSTTNNSSFMDEIYALKADPEKADHYILDGKSIPVDKKTFQVEFRNGDALAQKTKEVLSTEHGPVIYRGNGKIYVLKSGAEHEFRGGQQFLEMMKAHTLEEWKDAMRMQGIITSNFTYADADGNIFYVWNGRVPDLPEKWSENKDPITVTSSDQIWSDVIPWDNLPHLENPKGGYLRNENDTFHFTNLNEVLEPKDFPDYFPEPTFKLRSQSSSEMIHDADKKFSLEDVVDEQNISRMILADRVKDDLLKAGEDAELTNEEKQALDMLKNWDNTVDVDSKGGVLFKSWWYRYVATAPTKGQTSSAESVGFSAKADELFETPWSYDKPESTPYGLADSDRAVEAFKWAVKKTKEDYGNWDVAWGEVHRAIAGDKNVAANGCTGLLGCFRVLWFTNDKVDGKKIQKVRGGDGWTIAIEFGDTPRAYSILAYGQSDQEDSPYYYDQLELFMDKGMKTVLYSDKEVESNTIRAYRPGIEKE